MYGGSGTHEINGDNSSSFLDARDHGDDEIDGGPGNDRLSWGVVMKTGTKTAAVRLEVTGDR